MAYIKLEEAIEKIDNLKCECDAHFYGEALTDAKSELLALPTADVVEVVRCKDCKFRGTDDCSNSYYLECEGAYVDPMEDDDFCSYGERRR